MSEHTPTPYNWVRNNRGNIAVVSKTESWGPMAEILMLHSNYTPDLQEANAEFIIRACNSHDDLLAALENVQWIDEGRSDTGPVLVCPACRHGPKQGHGLDCVIGNAIAKTKG